MSLHQAWKNPVLVQLPNTSDLVAVSTVRGALDLLMKQWPGPKSMAFWQAANACSLCVDGRLGAELARKAFVVAAREAGIRLEEMI